MLIKCYHFDHLRKKNRFIEYLKFVLFLSFIGAKFSEKHLFVEIVRFRLSNKNISKSVLIVLCLFFFIKLYQIYLNQTPFRINDVDEISKSSKFGFNKNFLMNHAKINLFKTTR